jgi:hypothetical protein
MQGRVQQPDRHRQPPHDLEQLDEIRALHGQKLRQRGAARLLVLGEDHLAHGADAVLSKNMCSVRQSPMPSAPNLSATRASFEVSALARTPSVRTASAQPINVPNSPDRADSVIGTRPAITCPVEPSMVMISPALNVRPGDYLLCKPNTR